MEPLLLLLLLLPTFCSLLKADTSGADSLTAAVATINTRSDDDDSYTDFLHLKLNRCVTPHPRLTIETVTFWENAAAAGANVTAEICGVVNALDFSNCLSASFRNPKIKTYFHDFVSNITRLCASHARVHPASEQALPRCCCSYREENDNDSDRNHSRAPSVHNYNYQHAATSACHCVVVLSVIVVVGILLAAVLDCIDHKRKKRQKENGPARANGK